MKNLFKKGLNTVLYAENCQSKIEEFVKEWSDKDNVDILRYDGEKFVTASNNHNIDTNRQEAISILTHKLDISLYHPLGHNKRSVPYEVMKLIEASDTVFGYESEKDEFAIIKYRGVSDMLNVKVKLDQLI